MAKTLAIKVKYSSEGEGKVIRNINELEGAIEQLSSELKTLDFGTEEYKRTASELNRLKSEFKDIEKTVEGLDVEARLSAIGGALNVVTGSFLIASSAARTFGASAETVEEVEKLELQALEAVNIAMGVRAVVEGAVQAAKLKTIAAEKLGILQTNLATAAQTAYTAVVGASTGALKVFKLALASTGIGLIIVAIGELVANWDNLTSAIFGSNEEADRFNDINKEARKNIAKTNVELDIYAGIVNDVTKSENERLEALDQLNKLGVVTEDITLDQADALDILNERLELARDNILLKAQAEAASALLTEALKKQIEAQSSSLEDNLSWWEEGLFAISKYTSVMGFYTADAARAAKAAENQAEAVAEVTDEVEKYEKIYVDILEKLNASESKLNKERDKARKNRDKDKKAKEDRNKVDDKYSKILEKLEQNLKKTTEATKTLATATRGEVKIVEDLSKLLEEQNSLLEERLEILGDSKGVLKEQTDFAEQLERLIGGVVIPKEGLESLKDFQDVFKDLLTTIDQYNEFASGGEESGIDGYYSRGEAADFERNRLEKLREELSKLSDEQIDEEQRKILLDFFQKQVDINDKAVKYNEILQETINKQDEIKKNLKQQLDTGQIDLETYNKRIKNLDEIIQKNQDLTTGEADFQKILLEIVELQQDQIKNNMTTKELEEEILNVISTKIFKGQEYNDLTDVQKDLVKEINTDLQDQSKLYAETLSVAEELEKITGKISANITAQEQELSDAQFTQLENFIKQNEGQINQVKSFFATLRAENSNLTQEQIDNLQRLIDGIEFNQKFAGIQEFADKVIEEFNQISSGIQGVLASSISLQLEQLNYFEEQSLASIGDATERAKEIQEETRREIAEERFNLEKKARLQELGFSLAGAIANTAQAVLKALATVPPPGGQILAAIYGGIGAAQTAVVLDQINFVKGTEFTGRRGGLIMGEDHENGGVRMNGGLVLEGGEAILNKNAVAQFSDLLSQINVQTGGRALSIDDSALVQEIRKQNQKPIKTYVLYNDIRDTNKINTRLEQISRL
jgi:hypothetical protein